MNELEQKAEQLITAAKSRNIKISLAESCTGGLIGAVITAIPGASEVFYGTAVTYVNEAKENILGVSHETLKEAGAVSSECARQMAEGSRKIYKSDIAVSVTGIAGPDGGSIEKPVGTVWFGISCAAGGKTFVRHFTGDRKTVRNQTAAAAIEALTEWAERGAL